MAGLAALIGLLALANNRHRDTSPYVVAEVTPVGQNTAGVYNNSGNSQVVAPEFAAVGECGTGESGRGSASVK